MRFGGSGSGQVSVDGLTIIGNGLSIPLSAIGAAPSGDASLNSLKLALGGAIDLTLANYNDWDPGWTALGNASNVPLGSSFIGGSTITGMVPHPGGRGQIVTLQNKMPGPPIRIAHMSPLSLAKNRILCPNEQDLILPSGGAAFLQVMALNDGVHGWRTLGISTSAFQQADLQYLLLGRFNLGPEDSNSPYSIVKGGCITPTALAAGANADWVPSGYLNAGVIRVTAGAGATLSGMGGVLDGVKIGDIKVLEFFNAVTVQHQTTSDATRQFFLPGSTNIAMPVGGSMICRYDQLQRWWPLAIAK